MAQFGQGVTLNGMVHPEFGYTFELDSSVTVNDIGLAVSMSDDNKVIAAQDTKRIVGILFSYENRTQEGVKVGAVRTKGAWELPVKTGVTLAVGDSVVGGGDGKVAKSATYNSTVVVEVRTDTVIVLFN